MSYFLAFITAAASTMFIFAGQIEIGITLISYLSVFLLLDVREQLQKIKKSTER